MADGWVKNWRKIEEWQWYTVPNMAHLFQHLIRNANHRDKWWQGVKVGKGQLITSRMHLAIATGLSVRSVRTCLKRLSSTRDIEVKATNRFTLITICNYDRYQSENGGSDPQNDQPTTSQRPASDQQATTNKNVKNVKNVKKYSSQFEAFWNSYPRKNGKGAAYRRWVQIKPDEDLQAVILAAVETQKTWDQWKRDGGQYIPHPATWLNQSRWEDEPPKKVAAATSACCVCGKPSVKQIGSSRLCGNAECQRKAVGW